MNCALERPGVSLPASDMRRRLFSEQDLPVQVDGFEGRDLKIRTNFWTGPNVFIDGIRVRRRHGMYTLRSNAGVDIPMSLKGRFLDPIPNVEMGGATIQLAPTMKWHEYLMVCLPFTLVLIGGAVGAMVGAAGAYMNAKIVRSSFNIVFRYLLCTLVALVVALAYVDLAARFIKVTDLFKPIAERVGDRKNYSGIDRQSSAAQEMAPSISLPGSILVSRTWIVREVLFRGSRQTPNLLLKARRQFHEDGSFSQVYRDGSESRGLWKLDDVNARVVVAVGDAHYAAEITELTGKTLRMRTGEYEIIHVAE